MPSRDERRLFCRCRSKQRQLPVCIRTPKLRAIQLDLHLVDATALAGEAEAAAETDAVATDAVATDAAATDAVAADAAEAVDAPAEPSEAGDVARAEAPGEEAGVVPEPKA